MEFVRDKKENMQGLPGDLADGMTGDQHRIHTGILLLEVGLTISHNWL